MTMSFEQFDALNQRDEATQDLEPLYMNEGDLLGKKAAKLAKQKQHIYRRVQLQHYHNAKISSINL